MWWLIRTLCQRPLLPTRLTTPFSVSEPPGLSPHRGAGVFGAVSHDAVSPPRVLLVSVVTAGLTVSETNPGAFGGHIGRFRRRHAAVHQVLQLRAPRHVPPRNSELPISVVLGVAGAGIGWSPWGGGGSSPDASGFRSPLERRDVCCVTAGFGCHCIQAHARLRQESSVPSLAPISRRRIPKVSSAKDTPVYNQRFTDSRGGF